MNVLATLKITQENSESQLNETSKYRHALITKINHTIQDKGQELSMLLHNKEQLENTLNSLQQNTNYAATANDSFSKLQGKLLWPTKGKIANHFGDAIYQSELKWNGVVIDAPANQPVYAIAEGKVVFAKWLTGYGLMLIINHGDGFMSLYGRNQSLYKSEGDVVHAGDPIATVGNSGGYSKPALYFTIWHNSQAMNPEKWCH